MDRTYWKKRITEHLRDRNVLWLSGVRRVGKTTLVKSLPNVEYFDCELPSARQALDEPERFLTRMGRKTIVLDEIHRLINPSEVLKIAADHFPHLKVIATGSSTLAAKSKFKDTLTGRKRELWLLPAIYSDMKSLPYIDVDKRMLRGGLPPFLLAHDVKDMDYVEWIESYWAKDVQELFVVEKRASFMRFIELLFRQSGNLFEAQSFAAPCEISRQTVFNYLEILETTLLASVIRPFSNGGSGEIKTQPKIYGFDTGFVSFFRGISNLDHEDRGNLLEHLVLGELQAIFLRNEIYYWRDKQRHEVDFVVKKSRGKKFVAIECKSKSSNFDASRGLKSFRSRYPDGKNILVSLDRREPETKVIDGLEITLCGVQELAGLLQDV